MKTLHELFPDCPSQVQICHISINSRECRPGSLFVCIPGVQADRHDFIPDAVARGASAVVVSREVPDPGVPVIRVRDCKHELALICRRFYEAPEQKLKLLGVTGTDGKTSTATILQTLLGDDHCGFIGTHGRSCRGFHGDNPNTTPDVDLLYAYFREFVDRGCDQVAMECSSEAFYRGRLWPFQFDLAIYTNVTSEHLNVHGSLENYLACKTQLFAQTKPEGYCILNLDEAHCEAFRKAARGQLRSYGRGQEADLRIVDFELHPDHSQLHFRYQGQDLHFRSPLLGEFNVYNLAAALLAALCLGVSAEEAISRLPQVHVPGRLTMLPTGLDFYAMVDYAHTPNGIAKLLDFVKQLKIQRSIVVIGQAGERDASKRPHVGKVLLSKASHVILTSEDPRREDPAAICQDILSGMPEAKNYEIELDRRKAIRRAVALARSGDILLLLGKGNETDFYVGEGSIHLSDPEELQEALELRRRGLLEPAVTEG